MKYPFLFRLLHWVLTASLLVLMLTGLSLHAVAQPGWSLFGGRLPGWFWPGRVNLVHLAAALAFLPSLLAVLVIFLWRPTARRGTHFVLLLGGLAMILSAMVLLNPYGPPVVYTIARLIHGVTAAVLAVAFIWHLAEGLGRYRGLLVAAFHPWAQPRLRQVAAFLPLPLIGACLILNGWPTHPAWRTLVATRTSSVAGDADALPWEQAQPVQVQLANGMGFDRGRTQVTLRALHDGDQLCLLAEWADPVENRQYTPWQKTRDGWKHLSTDKADECVFYEDKFSLIFPIQPDWKFERFGCAAQCHVGGKNAYGYKCSEAMVDCWHWKSVRTDPSGRVDDQYWWKPDFAAKTVGRFNDPKTSGGYDPNAAKTEPRPAFLPDDLAAIHQGMIPRDHARPYSPEQAARVPVDTLIPGIVASAFEGDRGDVHCVSRHEAGHWRVVICRKLDTGSQYDTKFVPGQEYCFSCAAFDHTSKRHAYDLNVYRLRLEP
jgi:hypothetical protein